MEERILAIRWHSKRHNTQTIHIKCFTHFKTSHPSYSTVNCNAERSFEVIKLWIRKLAQENSFASKE
jgi:hypothetical protein